MINKSNGLKYWHLGAGVVKTTTLPHKTQLIGGGSYLIAQFPSFLSGKSVHPTHGLVFSLLINIKDGGLGTEPSRWALRHPLHTDRVGPGTAFEASVSSDALFPR